jgi:hypothetical protein
MVIKYIHISNPEVEKFYDTERAFQNPPRIYKTQQEFDEFELKHFAEDKERGIVISYEIVDLGIKMSKSLYRLVGYREREILNNFTKATVQMNTEDYLVLRFYGRNRNYFDYEMKSHRITG